MDQPSDVQRLFSWLKTQDLQYREFAATREVKDVVATWPALHEAAAGTGRPADVPPPTGPEIARERIAHETMPMPPAAAEAIKAEPPTVVPPQPLAGSRLLSALGRRLQATRTEPPTPGEATVHEPLAATRPPAPDAAAATSTPQPSLPGLAPERPTTERPAPSRPAQGERAQSGRFFSGAYAGGERSGARRGHSLEAVFSRLSGGRSRSLPDPRDRSRASPGLGSVFDRLR
jgi:hypothetical protein